RCIFRCWEGNMPAAIRFIPTLAHRSNICLLNKLSTNRIPKIGYCLLLLCMCVQATAQHVVDDRQFPDSLQQVLETAKTLKEKMEALFLLSDFYSTRDTSKALDFARQSIG